jgi:hypothetical protein
MLLRIDENPNCEIVEGRVLTPRGDPRRVTHALRQRNGKEIWCPIIAWGEKGESGPATACKVDDSGEGTCYVVYGGTWGLRLKEPECDHAWSQDEPHQWGEAFLLLPPSGSDLKFS